MLKRVSLIVYILLVHDQIVSVFIYQKLPMFSLLLYSYAGIIKIKVLNYNWFGRLQTGCIPIPKHKWS